jgi:hypothetical protein
MAVERFRRDGGSRQGAYHITCSGCGATAEVANNQEGKSLPEEIVAKKFRQKGWDVGHRPQKDKCPACQSKRRKGMRYTVDKNLRVDVKQPQRPILTIVKKEPAVATLSREDRRIILAKLNEAYQDESQGYRPGWSDQRVADDLGVAVEWVQLLREENFGDLPVSAQDKSFVEEGRRILEAIKAVAIEADEVRMRAASLLSQATEALDQVKALDKKMDDLLAQEELLAEQIAKVSHAA